MNRFVFVVPMFNASATLGRMLHSVMGQSYDNWRLVLIDDVSDRDHLDACAHTVMKFKDLSEGPDDRIKVVINDSKRWEGANVLRGLQECEPDDVVCRLDADDWLTDLDALAILDHAYRETGCDILWTAHRWGFSDKNISGPMPDGVDPYRYPWVSSHLKTFRRSLLDGIDDANFRGEDGDYIRRAGDQAIYLPALHRSRRRIFLGRVMYHYTIDDRPETYQTDDARFQKSEADFLRARGFVG